MTRLGGTHIPPDSKPDLLRFRGPHPPPPGKPPFAVLGFLNFQALTPLPTTAPLCESSGGWRGLKDRPAARGWGNQDTTRGWPREEAGAGQERGQRRGRSLGSAAEPAHAPPAASQVPSNPQDGGSAPGCGLPVHCDDPRGVDFQLSREVLRADLSVWGQVLEETPDSHQGGAGSPGLYLPAGAESSLPGKQRPGVSCCPLSRSSSPPWAGSSAE